MRTLTRLSSALLGAFVAVALVIVPVIVLASCAAGPSVEANSIRAYTPPRYLEHRLMYVRPVEGDPDRWNLELAYESYDSDFERDLAVRPGDPLSVVIGDVYLPRDFEGTRDIVVLIDIVASDRRGLESYAVWYQRGVAAGQRLGFDSLLVYSDRSWSPLNPPRFTVRVMDVSVESNRETLAAFESLNRAVGALSTFIPHPAVPGAATSLRVAGLVASNRQNVPIIDFTPQFYGADFVASAGPSDIPMFMRGTWLAIGRAEGATEEFWRTHLQMDRRTGQVLDENSTVVNVPYMRVTIATAESVVPTLVLERSQALFEMLTERRSGDDVVTAVSKELSSGLKTYDLHRQVVSTRSKTSLGELASFLDNETLTRDDRQFLLTVFSRTTKQNFASPADAKQWWAENAGNGQIDPQSGRWVPNE